MTEKQLPKSYQEYMGRTERTGNALLPAILPSGSLLFFLWYGSRMIYQQEQRSEETWP